MKKLISVIVPVYKVEDYLECCLDSLCRQSMPEIEIILIDDASPDRCGEICDAYAARDERFRVVHRPENKGLSAARNLGISLASCDYLMFADSDDWVHDDFCRDAYQCAKQNHADLVMFDFQFIKDKNELPAPAGIVSTVHKTRDEAVDLLFTKVQNFSWNKLYRKELFDGVYYPERFLFEDIATIYKTVLKASNIYYMDKTLYYYRWLRPNSITANYNKVKYWFKMRMLQLTGLWNAGCRSEQFLTYLNKLAMNYCIKNRKKADDPDYAFFAHVLRQNKKIPKGLSSKRKILFVLFKYWPSAFELICNLLVVR